MYSIKYKCTLLEVQISGTLSPRIGDLKSLRVLNLSWNHLDGSIPNTLGRIKNMRRLSLAGNNLSGSIPTSLGQLNSLEVLELSSNSLSGEIPENIASLRNLSVLLLNNNKLSGQLLNISNLSAFNVSFNNLSGHLPSNNNVIKCNSFLGNPFLHCPMASLSSLTFPDQQGSTWAPITEASSSQSSSKQKKQNNLNSIEIASISSAAAIVSVLIALIFLFFYTRKWKPRSRVSGTLRKEVIVFTDIGAPLDFENVARATGSFNATNCIGNGGFGATYKAEITPGVLVAVKRLSLGRFQGVQQFDAEIKTLGRLRHPNLVTLIGYHASETEMFLIYNYLPGGNLEKFIHERSIRAVSWTVLHKIALDIARALAYLHEQCVPRVLHRDVKPSNMCVFSEKFQVTINVAELLALREGLKVAWARRVPRIVVEVDSEVVFKLFKKQDTISHPFHYLLEDCRKYMHLPWEFEFYHVRREANICADYLARMGHSVVSFELWTDPPPLVALLESDVEDYPHLP
ncbi:hypothetical protein OROGR_023664 [Orobanche gracilis]